MVCRRVDIGSRSFDYCPDNPPPLLVERNRALIRARVIDEITGEPLNGSLQVTSDHPRLTPRVASGALVGLVGSPGREFPGLGGGPISVPMEISAERYIARRVQSDISLDPDDWLEVALHRQPVPISGRTVRRTGGGPQAIANVSVEITGIWDRFPQAHEIPANLMEDAFLLSLSPGLYLPRFTSTAQVQRRDVVEGLALKRVIQPAISGDRAIRLSDCIDLFVGELLVIQSGIRDRMEIMTITDIRRSGPDDQPAWIDLALPLAHDHLQGAEALPGQAQIPGPPVSLRRSGQVGDPVLLLQTMAPLAGAQVIEITGGGVSEFQRVWPYRVMSDMDGYYQLPPLSRVAQVQIEATRTDVPASITFTLGVEYELPTNRRDLVFS